MFKNSINVHEYSSVQTPFNITHHHHILLDNQSSCNSGTLCFIKKQNKSLYVKDFENQSKVTEKQTI